MIYTLILLVFTLGAFYTDYRRSNIPNWLNLAAIASGIVVHSMIDGFQGVVFALLGMLCGFSTLIILYWLGGLGAGDVKFFAGVGAIMGAEFVLSGSLYSLVFASIIGVGIVAVRRQLLTRVVNVFRACLFLLFLREKSAFVGLKGDSFQFPFMYAVIPGLSAAYYSFM